MQLDNSYVLQDDEIRQLQDNNGQAAPPILRNGRILVPLRWLAQVSGFTVTWNSNTRAAVAEKNDKRIEVFNGSTEILVNEQTVELDTPAILQNGTLYAPVRTFGQVLGWRLSYVPEEQGGLIFLEKTDEAFVLAQSEIAMALQQLGPSHAQILYGSILLRPNADSAIINGSRVKLMDSNGKTQVPKQQDGYYWIPADACARTFGATAYLSEDGSTCILRFSDNEEAHIVSSEVYRKGQTLQDDRYQIWIDNHTVYVTMQAFGAACGLWQTFPNADSIALTRDKLYGYPDQMDFVATLIHELPYRKPPIPQGDAYIALTFDDGPTGGKNGLTVQLLEGLKARGVHATFFLCGYRVKDFHTHMDRYLAEGHELGNHTMDHPLKFANLSEDKIYNQVNTNSILIESYTRQRPTVIRPVGGAVSSAVKTQMKKLGLPIINWSVDTLDWKYRDAERIKNVILKEAKDGDIVLLHDLHQPTVDGVLAAIDELKKQGYAFVTVHELASIKGVALNPGEVYSSIH